MSDAKLQKILEILDYYMGTDEGYVAYQFGKENVHFDWEGDPWQSKPIVRPAEEVPDEFPERGGASFYPRYRTDARMHLILEGHTADWTTNYLLQPAGQRISMRPYKWDFFNDTDLLAVNQRVGETLGTMFNEYFLRALTGEIDVDDTWETLGTTSTSRGGTRTAVTRCWQSSPRRRSFPSCARATSSADAGARSFTDLEGNGGAVPLVSSLERADEDTLDEILLHEGIQEDDGTDRDDRDRRPERCRRQPDLFHRLELIYQSLLDLRQLQKHPSEETLQDEQ